MRDFLPGDVILKKDRPAYMVSDPVRTSAGKLRLHSMRGEVVSQRVITTWWRHPSTGYVMPEGYSAPEDLTAIRVPGL